MHVTLPTGNSFCLLLAALVLSGCSSTTRMASPTQAPPNATATISISPAAVAPGQSATITWSSSNATSCSATGAWSGSLATSGSATVMLQGSTAQTYTVTCSGGGLPGEHSATLSLSSGEGQCTAAAAARSPRLKLPRAIAAARQAVASGAAGQKKPAIRQ